MQLRLTTGLTSDEYVKQEAWRTAILERCPLHPAGCDMGRHGSYQRVEPPGVRVARFYCATGHVTFSLLPDFLASRLSGTLQEVEQVVAASEQLGVTGAARKLRPDIELEGAVRWVRQRRRAVHGGLVAIAVLLPDAFPRCQPTVFSFRAALGVAWALSALRELASAHLGALPPCLGFGPRPRRREARPLSRQQGPDPALPP